MAIAVELFIRLIGDLPLAAVGATESWGFKRKLAELPARHGRSPFDDPDPERVIARARRREAAALDAVDARRHAGGYADPGAADLAEHRAFVPRLSPKTINKHLDNVAVLFRLLAGYGVLPFNPFHGVRYTAHEMARRPRRDRAALADDEVAALLRSPLIVGRGVRHDTLGRRHEDRTAYWLWLLLAYAGVRPEEAAQLQADDIQRLDGVWCLVVRGDGARSIKNGASVRLVPLHDTVRRLGFLELVAARRRAGGGRLFAELTHQRGPATKPDAKAIHRTTSLSCQTLQRMNDYLRGQEIAPGRTVYSLRHTFVTKLGNTEIPERVLDELVGHAPTGETLARYFKGVAVGRLQAAIDRLDYGVTLQPAPDGGLRIAPAAAGAAAPAAGDGAEIVPFPPRRRA